jgi:hypothetical protein
MGDVAAVAVLSRTESRPARSAELLLAASPPSRSAHGLHDEHRDLDTLADELAAALAPDDPCS